MRYVEWYGKSRRQNWCTPSALFDGLHARYAFTLDGASEPGNGLLPRASTAEAPLAWSGERVFCNPPWSNIRPFVENAPAADLAVLLCTGAHELQMVPSRAGSWRASGVFQTQT
jgi:hypothetical protein